MVLAHSGVYRIVNAATKPRTASGTGVCGAKNAAGSVFNAATVYTTGALVWASFHCSGYYYTFEESVAAVDL